MINKVILIGNVGADPEIRTLESGTKVARIRLATTERLYNRQTQEAKEHTEWHSITLWRNMADTVDRFVKKGSRLYVEGRIRSNNWQDQNGVQRYSYEIQADDVKLLDRRSDAAPQQGQNYTQTPQPQTSAPAPAPAPAQVSNPAADDVDDLPF